LTATIVLEQWTQSNICIVYPKEIGVMVRKAVTNDLKRLVWNLYRIVCMFAEGNSAAFDWF